MIKKIVKQTLNTCISLIKILFSSSFNKRYKLQKKKKVATCSILANGPSLNNMIDSLLPSDNVDYFAVNFFALSEHFFRLKPSGYVFADPAFWYDENNIHQEIVSQRNELIKRISGINWNMTLYIPHKGTNSRVIRDLLQSNKYLKIAPYNITSFKGFDAIKNFTYKQNLCMPISQNVLTAALYLAINSGYENITFYGGDFSWSKSICVDRNNILCQIDNHFYDNKEVKLSPVMAYVDKPYRIHQYFYDLSKMFEGCWQVRYYANHLNAKVVNKNPDSFIDAFDKE